MIRTVTSLFALFLLLPLSAEAAKFKIDPVHSSVSFKIRHFFSKVPGHFNKFSGTFNFDKKNPKKSWVRATIQAASIDTGNKKRDKHLRSKDFFYVKKFPKITFKSTKVLSFDGKKGKVKGKLTMRGVTKDVVLQVTFLGLGSAGKGKVRSGFTATTTVNRYDFNIKYAPAILGKEVTINIEISALKTKKS